ncbi:hypothetical protein ACWC9U_26590 [Streptomyces sp. 900116325]
MSKHEADEIERWTRVASEILWRLSGMRWGPSCPVTIRPCGKSCVEQYAPFWTAGVPQSGGRIPYMDDGGVWRNAVCGCRTDCSCTELCQLKLDGPVFDVLSVVVDGVTLPPEAYRVDVPNILVRLDGECWDACQQLDEAPTEPGTAAVTYRPGLPLTEAAIAAVSELVCHYLAGCGGGSCGCNATVRNATRISRQGIEIERPDPTIMYESGLTGLPIADAWLMAVNPYRLKSQSRAYSPDYRRPRTHQWP